MAAALAGRAARRRRHRRLRRPLPRRHPPRTARRSSRPIGMRAEFPPVEADTRSPRARDDRGSGLRAVLTCVDPKQGPARARRPRVRRALLDELPAGRRSVRRERRVSHVRARRRRCASPFPVRVGESSSATASSSPTSCRRTSGFARSMSHELRGAGPRGRDVALCGGALGLRGAAAPDNSPDPCAVLADPVPVLHAARARSRPARTRWPPPATTSSAPSPSTTPQVIADCVVPDGGGDGAPEATTDAPPLPVCDAAQAAPDAGCSCVPPCVTTCPVGGCQIVCPGGATCQASCSGGACVFQCAAGSTCTTPARGAAAASSAPPTPSATTPARARPRAWVLKGAQSRQSRRSCSTNSGRKTPSTRIEYRNQGSFSTPW
jgi:hypothetical protein